MPGRGYSGFEPRTTPAERRAFFDIDRRIREARRSFAMNYSYTTSTTPPPSTGDILINATSTTIWMHETDANGYFQGVLLERIRRGDLILLRDTSSNYAIYQATADTINQGVYVEIPVTARVDTGANITPNTTIRVDAFISVEEQI